MRQGDFETFGQWLLNRMETVRLSQNQFASYLGHSDGLYAKRLCNDETRLQMKDWPIVAKLLQLRLDEFLIVLEYFHPNWVMEYDAFISNCLRYLLWRVEQDQQHDLPLPEFLLTVTLDEVIEPACISRFDSTEDQRKIDRRTTQSAPAEDKRGKPRRLTDLVRYLKNQLGGIALFPLFASGLFLMHGWSLS
ncbi:MAG: hypothetical protein HY204_03390 [Nitrospirae bacterium]|nr:hypothetical protein [Nitrospirota bacterium]